ncbi:MAG: VOC family protein [Pseudomonadota bacterium]
MVNIPFHLAIPVTNLLAAKAFYHGVLGCALGRQSDDWIDYNFFGHQLVTHLSDDMGADICNAVDGDAVPVRHFGCVLEWSAWEALATSLRQADVPFLLEPRIRFAGEPGEQGTFFVKDPSGNALEFKTFRDADRLFATGDT